MQQRSPNRNAEKRGILWRCLVYSARYQLEPIRLSFPQRFRFDVVNFENQLSVEGLATKLPARR